MNNFLKMADSGEIQSYSDFLKEINNQHQVSSFIKEENIKIFFLKFVSCILSGSDCYLIDSDFSEFEINEILPDRNKIDSKTPCIFNYSSLDGLMSDFVNSNSIISIFTSGTTGRPKVVQHTLLSLTNGVRIGEQYRVNRWLFAYNPTHMAGVQVFLQAFLNKNYINYVFKADKKVIFSAIEEDRITHVSATPTFYRMLLPTIKSFDSVQSIAFGGEKSDKSFYDKLKRVFPKAKIVNIYASTEGGSLFRSIENDVFEIPDRLLKLIKIENDELILHSSILGKLDGSDELWYNTGDLVEVINWTPIQFKFISRKSELVNVGGYKVNPSEVENELQKMNSVKMCCVYGIPNSVLGNIICADIVLHNQNLDAKKLIAEIKTVLGETLQTFKIPRKINFVDIIALTRSGKVKR
jgi:acyl-coenzyme A synthetase/AMP-(fatty) acid ligase